MDLKQGDNQEIVQKGDVTIKIAEER